MAVELADDPLLSQQRRDAVALIAGWLRRHDRVSVLSMTAFGGDGGGTGHPSRSFDVVAVEADLDQAIDKLPLLERIACLLSKEVDRGQDHWFRDVIQPGLLRLAPNEWLQWTYHVEEVHGRTKRPYEALLDQSAELLADLLGPAWWPPLPVTRPAKKLSR